MNSWDDAWPAVAVVVVAALLMAVAYVIINRAMVERFEECMREKNDRYICETYAAVGP